MSRHETFSGPGLGPVQLAVLLVFLGRFSVILIEPQHRQLSAGVQHPICSNTTSSSSGSAAAGASTIGTDAAACSKVQSSMAAGTPGLQPLSFYVPPSQSDFRKVAGSVTPVTDKIGATSVASNLKHTYDALYRCVVRMCAWCANTDMRQAQQT